MSKNKGFTLLELLAVVAILAIIAVLAIPSYTGAIEKARTAKALAEKDSVQKAVTMYYTETGHYPTATLPAEGSPQNLVLSDLVPNYLASQPQGGTWTIDYLGKVYNSSGSSGAGETQSITSGDPSTMLTDVQWSSFDWSAVKAPTGQTSANLGVDSWGNPVNMDLWDAHKITLADNSTRNGYTTVGTIALNLSDGSLNGYKGSLVNGQIVGYVPAYVKMSGDSSYQAVTDLDGTFYNLVDLTTAPILPNSVTNMRLCYMFCYNLTTVPALPVALKSLNCAFANCNALSVAPAIPAGVDVLALADAFESCGSLKEMPALPGNIDPYIVFRGCRQFGY